MMYATRVRADGGGRWTVREGGLESRDLGGPEARVAPEPADLSGPAATDAGPRVSAETAEPDFDALYELGERCAETYMRADQLHYEAMVLLAEYDAREGWRGTGFGGTAEWLAWRVGIKLHTAKDRLRVALALQNLPLTSEAMASGGLSYSKARGLARWARPESEAALLELAQSTSAARFERECRAIKQLDRASEATAEARRHKSRRFSVFVDDDGMYVVTGRLDPEVGALLMRAVEAATDALYTSDADPDQTEPEQRRADAIGLVAERAMAAGFKGDGSISGTRARRYQVTLHVDAQTLSADGEPGRSELGDGNRVSAETARRLCCDVGIVQMEHAPDGRIVSVSHLHRTIPPSLRRALEARDRGCRFPACGLRFTDGHHLKHWADEGKHSLDNTLLLCVRHHRAVHEGQVRVVMNHQGVAVFYAPNGNVMMSTPPGMTLGPVNARETPPRDTLPWHKKGAARYPDSDLPVDVLTRAREAM